jgi:hypothetical protein
MEQNIAPEELGRATDTVLGHLSLGEIVIPRAMQDDPQFMAMLQQAFQAFDTDINEFTVGHAANKINPETGYPEFFKKFFKRIARVAVPAALSYFAPGIGQALGGSILGAGAAGASTLGNALIGGGIGALSGGGLKGALTGAVTGGIGANIGSLGSGLQGPSLSGAPLDSGGSGILGALRSSTGLTSSNLPSLSGLVGGSGGSSSFGGLNTLSSALGGFQQDNALKKIRQQQLGAQQQQLANLENLNPEDVQNDPGYQFNLEQGQQGLNRALGAQGGLFSGNALKEAAKFNQGLAQNYYGEAYARQANKVDAQNTIYGNQGDINANATLGRSNNLNQTLANALGGQVGNYSGSQDELLKQLMLRRG